MEVFFQWTTKTSLRGVPFLFSAENRKFSCRQLWLLLFTTCTALFVYYQVSLIHDIFVLKPKIVDLHFTRQNEINFPNVVICSLNPSLPKVVEVSRIFYGNTGLMNAQFIQTALNYLYEPVRILARRNVTEAMMAFPYMEVQYAQYFQVVDPRVYEAMR